MMINIGARLATVNIVFSTSRNAASIESEMLQYKTPSIKLHHCTLSELKNPSLYFVRRPCLSLDILRGSETTLKLGFF